MKQVEIVLRVLPQSPRPALGLLQAGRLHQELAPLGEATWEGLGGLVFRSESETFLEDKRVHQVFARICESADLPKIRPYDLRHSSTSLLLAAGVHPKIVAERLGQSTVNLTLSTDSHVLPTVQQDAVETLGRPLRTSRT